MNSWRRTASTSVRPRLLVGLQLTHSGRFSRPNGKQLEPRIAYHHPLLDEKFGIDPTDATVVWTDSDLERLVDRYVVAAGLARDAGFRFVDVKACHGYLLHDFSVHESGLASLVVILKGERDCSVQSSAACATSFQICLSWFA